MIPCCQDCIKILLNYLLYLSVFSVGSVAIKNSCLGPCRQT